MIMLTWVLQSLQIAEDQSTDWITGSPSLRVPWVDCGNLAHQINPYTDSDTETNKAEDHKDGIEEERISKPPQNVIVHKEQQREPEPLRDTLQEISALHLCERNTCFYRASW